MQNDASACASELNTHYVRVFVLRITARTCKVHSHYYINICVDVLCVCSFWHAFNARTPVHKTIGRMGGLTHTRLKCSFGAIVTTLTFFGDLYLASPPAQPIQPSSETLIRFEIVRHYTIESICLCGGERTEMTMIRWPKYSCQNTPQTTFA